MSIPFKIVVSSENTSYLAWQTQLFCYSALSRLGIHPIVVVHQTNEILRPEFHLLSKCGFRVIEAPSFNIHPKAFYPARNELGSLLTVSDLSDLEEDCVLFCEADMLFTDSVVYDGPLAAEYYGYLDYAEERVQVVARQFGIGDSIDQLNATKKVGVPYLIPPQYLRQIARRWLEVLDAFDAPEWIDIMYAFGLALVIEKLDQVTTRMLQDNFRPMAFLSGRVIHYCHGDFVWNKRHFSKSGTPLELAVETGVKGSSGTVLREILSQINEAKAFFRQEGQIANLSHRCQEIDNRLAR